MLTLACVVIAAALLGGLVVTVRGRPWTLARSGRLVGLLAGLFVVSLCWLQLAVQFWWGLRSPELLDPWPGRISVSRSSKATVTRVATIETDVRRFFFSRSGDFLAYVTRGKQLAICELGTGMTRVVHAFTDTPLTRWEGRPDAHTMVPRVVWSPDSRRVMFADPPDVYLYDWDTGQKQALVSLQRAGIAPHINADEYYRWVDDQRVAYCWHEMSPVRIDQAAMTAATEDRCVVRDLATSQTTPDLDRRAWKRARRARSGRDRLQVSANEELFPNHRGQAVRLLRSAPYFAFEGTPLYRFNTLMLEDGADWKRRLFRIHIKKGEVVANDYGRFVASWSSDGQRFHFMTWQWDAVWGPVTEYALWRLTLQPGVAGSAPPAKSEGPSAYPAESIRVIGALGVERVNLGRQVSQDDESE
jgi:hypothetical protein